MSTPTILKKILDRKQQEVAERSAVVSLQQQVDRAIPVLERAVRVDVDPSAGG